MKQYITTKQLSELSEKGKRKLRKWVEDKDFWLSPLSESDHQLSLSVGQMVEFLDENTNLRPDKNPYKLLMWEDELCDGLWRKIKEILEK